MSQKLPVGYSTGLYVLTYVALSCTRGKTTFFFKFDYEGKGKRMLCFVQHVNKPTSFTALGFFPVVLGGWVFPPRAFIKAVDSDS